MVLPKFHLNSVSYNDDAESLPGTEGKAEGTLVGVSAADVLITCNFALHDLDIVHVVGRLGGFECTSCTLCTCSASIPKARGKCCDAGLGWSTG